MTDDARDVARMLDVLMGRVDRLENQGDDDREVSAYAKTTETCAGDDEIATNSEAIDWWYWNETARHSVDVWGPIIDSLKIEVDDVGAGDDVLRAEVSTVETRYWNEARYNTDTY